MVSQNTFPGGNITSELRGRGSDDGYENWRDAVHAGGQGDVADALTRLHRIQARPDCPNDLRSLCWSTAASLYRQAGRHAAASTLDGRAAGAAVSMTGDSNRWPRAAFADALIGLAADNLGLLRFGASRRLLDRARVVLADVGAPAQWSADDWDDGGRGWLRMLWVRSELAMYSGDGQTAVEFAQDAVETVAGVDSGPTTRHRIKTDLIAAAAQASVGNSTGAAEVARILARRAADEGLLPLQWAASSLLQGVGAASNTERDLHVQLETTLRRKGMPFTSAKDR